MNPWLKYLITAGIIVFVSEIAKKNDKLGALLVSLPLVSLLTMLWIFLESPEKERVEKLSSHAIYTFWYVLPTLPLFPVFSLLLKKGMPFVAVMGVYSLGTFVLFVLWAKLLEKWGIHLLP